MKRALAQLIFCLSPFLGQAQEVQKKEDNAMSRLPVGAILTNVSVPRFDEKKRRSSLLTAKTMRVESEEKLKGEDLLIYLFDQEEKVSNTAKIDVATYLVNEEKVIATGELLLGSSNDQFLARGQNGLLSLKSNQGILLGPAETMFLQQEKAPKKTTTTNSEQPVSSALPSQKTPLLESQGDFARAEAQELSMAQRITALLLRVSQSKLLAQAAAPAPQEVPFESLFEPNNKRIIIKSDEGFYFDSVRSEFSYLGNVKLQGKGITMTCKKGMKALFYPPQEKKKTDPEKTPEKDKENLTSGFKGVGEMKQFTATGDVYINGKDQEGNPIKLRGGRAVYNTKEDKIIIRGAPLSFLVKGIALRSNSKNASIVVRLIGKENINAQSDGGGWEISLPENIKKKK